MRATIMNEKEWVQSIIPAIEKVLQKKDKQLFIKEAFKLLYAYEVKSYIGDEPEEKNNTKFKFETDILIGEQNENGTWIPRVIIEAKLESVTTHDAITYSQKAMAHKNVHPYLRYGIIIGKIPNIPGRLIRHGQNFDFMLAVEDYKPNPERLRAIVELLWNEVEASRRIENMIYDSRSKSKAELMVLHRPLVTGR